MGLPAGDPVADDPQARLRKRSVTIAGHRTSVSLEQAFWDALKEIAAADRVSLNALVAGIDADRSGNLSSGLRVFVLHRLRDQAGSAGSTAGGASCGGPEGSGGASSSGSGSGGDG